MRPWELARLTDFQVLDFYLRRHAERMERAKAEADPADTPRGRAPNGSLPDRETAIHLMVAHLGMDPATAAADYDRAARGG